MSLLANLKDSIAVVVTDALHKYHKGFFSKRVLKSREEVEANTNEKNLVSAVVVGELIDNLETGLGGNNLIYNESEDAYYIQHGADSALKKLGNAVITVLKNVTGQKTVAIADIYSNYKALTADNFLLVPETGSASASMNMNLFPATNGYSVSASYSKTLTYSPDAGTLTVNARVTSWVNNANNPPSKNLTYSVYLVPEF